MIQRLWNIALKSTDLEQEVAFLGHFGAGDVQFEALGGAATGTRFAMLRLGDKRLLIFPEAVYEDRLPEPLREGLIHAAYVVDDLAATLDNLMQHGIRPVWGPAEVSGTFGQRRIAFFRSPSGFIFETMQIIEGSPD